MDAPFKIAYGLTVKNDVFSNVEAEIGSRL